MKSSIVTLIILLVTGVGLVLYSYSGRVLAQDVTEPTSTPTVIEAEENYVSKLPDYGAAPELLNVVWLNTDQPLPLSSLGGKIVLLEMWTFGCYNCVNTLPYVRAWHDTYASQGLVVIGNHYPEFDYESEIDNVRDALVRLDITYAVAQDNDATSWRAYSNRFWPMMYLIDKAGHLRYSHIGEGAYDTTEANIRDLLREDYTPPTEPYVSDVQSLTATTDLNVRNGPGTNYGQIGVIHPNEAFVIRSEQVGWYSIYYDGADGYVSGEYVTVTGGE